MAALTRRGAFVAMLGAAAPAWAYSAENERALAQALRRRCEGLARTEGLSGAVLLARGEQTLLREAYGLRNRGEHLPNSPETKFNLASIGKLFTSLSIMRLAEANRLDLDAPLIDAWPDYPNHAVAERITPAQILTHTAGLGNYFLFKPKHQFSTQSTHTDYLDLFANEPLEGEPGVDVSYSNDGYILLGALIERLMGKDFRRHCEETIFVPLGMRDTGFFALDDVVFNLAQPYVRDLERPGVWRSALVSDGLLGSAAGGSFSTVDDLARFMRAMAENRLLSPEWTRAWLADRVDFVRARYGYGVEVDVVNDERILGHSGGHYGIAGEAMWFTRSGYLVILLTNGEVEPFWDLANYARVSIAGETDASRTYAFTRELIEMIKRNGVEAGVALVAARERRPREGMIDVYAFRAWHAGDAAAAEALLAFNRRQFPDSLSALWSIAELYRHAGRRQEAIGAYRAFLERQPGDQDALRYIDQLS